jgi:hypothetical protein
MPTRNEVASQIWPHLAADRPAPRAQPQPTSPLAAALYPTLATPAPDPIKLDRAAVAARMREIDAKWAKSKGR